MASRSIRCGKPSPAIVLTKGAGRRGGRRRAEFLQLPQILRSVISQQSLFTDRRAIAEVSPRQIVQPVCAHQLVGKEITLRLEGMPSP